MTRRSSRSKASDEPNLRALRGSAAERAVANYLIGQGASIVALNLHIGRLELDVVAREGPVIIVVEVRTRGAGAWQSGFGSMDQQKRDRIRRAGERLWRDRYRNDETVERMRFDAASVVFEDDRAVVEYVKAAF